MASSLRSKPTKPWTHSVQLDTLGVRTCRDMVLCQKCNLEPSRKGESVVLPCSHVMCSECLQKVMAESKPEAAVQCTKCARVCNLPFGNLHFFPKDSFSQILDSVSAGDEDDSIAAAADPKCPVHLQEEVSMYCRECSLTVCPRCREEHHKDHGVVRKSSLESEADKELEDMNQNMTAKISQIRSMVDVLKEDQARMAADIHWTCERIREEAEQTIEKLESGQEDTNLKFDKVTRQLQEQQKLIEGDQIFVDALYHRGKASDKLARVSGMKDMIRNGQQFSGRILQLETLSWEFDVSRAEEELAVLFSKLQIAETLSECLQKNTRSLFPNLHHVRTVHVSCQPAYDTRSVFLFQQQHVIHTCGPGGDADKICVHKTTEATHHRISVSGLTQCVNPVVVDPDGGVIVAADMAHEWTSKLLRSKSRTHYSGTLHWLTLDTNYVVIEQQVTSLPCAQRGLMNVNDVGHLFVLTHCTTGQHNAQMLTFDNKRQILRAIALSDMLVEPISAVSLGPNTHVVMDIGTQRVVWVDQHGQVLQQYGQQPGEELRDALHAVMHSSRSLLVADWGHHRIHLISKEGKLLQYLLQVPDVQKPGILHLDEKAGLLCVEQGQDRNNKEVKIFRFCPRETHVRRLSLQGGLDQAQSISSLETADLLLGNEDMEAAEKSPRPGRVSFAQQDAIPTFPAAAAAAGKRSRRHRSRRGCSLM